MESENPFIQRIHASDDALEQYEEITDADKDAFLLRGQTMKFSDPEQFRFIYLPVEFIAFSVEGNDVKSLLLYLAETDEMDDVLRTAFGPADISLDVAGQVESGNASVDSQSYSSSTWVDGPYMMTFSIVACKDKEGNVVNKTQLFIR